MQKSGDPPAKQGGGSLRGQWLGLGGVGGRKDRLLESDDLAPLPTSKDFCIFAP